MQWMANLFLNIGEKPSWQLLIRGSLRNGKDSIIRPLAQILGARGASDIRSEDIDAGWGSTARRRPGPVALSSCSLATCCHLNSSAPIAAFNTLSKPAFPAAFDSN